MSLSNFPTSVDSFNQFSELPASQAANLATYQQLLQVTNPTTAQQQQLTTLQQELSSYIISADNINHLGDAIVSTQSYFLNQTSGYINSLQEEMNAELQQFTYVGTWSSTVSYKQWNVVSYQNQSYLCLLGNSNTSPTNTTYWSLIAAQGGIGPQGPAGAALSYIGTYSSLATYQINQLVTYNGSTYICLQNNTTNQVPTNTAYWTLFVTGATPLAQSTAPTNPVNNQLWINTTTDVTEYYNGTSWTPIAASALNDGTLNIIPSQIGTLNTANTWTQNQSFQGQISKVANQTTVGNYGVLTTLAFQRNKLLTTTGATQIFTFTPPVSGMYTVKYYLRVVTAATNVTLTINYADSGGAQSYTPTQLNNQSVAVGSHGVIDFDFEAVSGTPITLTVTAGTANQVYVTGTLVGVA